MSVAFADYDGDGFTDVFVTNDAIPDFLFHNRGNGTFEEVGLLAGVAVPAHGRPVVEHGHRLSRLRQRRLARHRAHGADRRDVPALQERRRASSFSDVTYAERPRLEHRAHERLGRGARRPRQRRIQGPGHRQLARQRSDRGVRVQQLPSAQWHLPQRRRRASQTSQRWRVRTSRWRGPIAASGIGDFDGDGRLDLVVTVLGDGAGAAQRQPRRPWLDHAARSLGGRATATASARASGSERRSIR